MSELERLVQLKHSNERLMDQLASSRVRLSDARPNASECDHRQAKHSAILGRLRANRMDALEILGR